MWRMKRPLWWWFYQVWKVLVVAPVVILTTIIGAGLILVLIPFVNPSTLSRVIAGTWARICAMVTPMAVGVTGRSVTVHNADAAIQTCPAPRTGQRQGQCR